MAVVYLIVYAGAVVVMFVFVIITMDPSLVRADHAFNINRDKSFFGALLAVVFLVICVGFFGDSRFVFFRSVTTWGNSMLGVDQIQVWLYTFGSRS